MDKRLKSINKKKTFNYIFTKGNTLHGRLFVLRWAPITGGEDNSKVCMFGYVITRKSGNAVKRNLLKRRVKHALRILINNNALQYITSNYCFIISAKNALKNACFSDIKDELFNLTSSAQKRSTKRNKFTRIPETSLIDT